MGNSILQAMNRFGCPFPNVPDHSRKLQSIQQYIMLTKEVKKNFHLSECVKKNFQLSK